MDYFGINSADDLPKIKEVLANQSARGTLIENAVNNHFDTENELSDKEENLQNTKSAADESGTTLIVADNGELIEKSVKSEDEESTAKKISDEEEIKRNKNTGTDNSSN